MRLETRPLPEVNLYDELTLARSRPASRTRQPGNNGYLVPPAAAAAAPDSNAARPSSGYSTPIPSNARPNSGYSTQIPSDTRPDSGYSAPDSSDSTPNDSGYLTPVSSNARPNSGYMTPIPVDHELYGASDYFTPIPDVANYENTPEQQEHLQFRL